MKSLILSGLVLFGIHGQAQTPQPPKAPVWVNHSGNDQVGQTLALKVEEGLIGSKITRRSTEFPRFQIDMSSVEVNSEEGKKVSIFSLVWLFLPGGNPPIYLGSNVGIVGQDAVKDVAPKIVKDIEWIIQKVKEAAQSGEKGTAQKMAKAL